METLLAVRWAPVMPGPRTSKTRSGPRPASKATTAKKATAAKKAPAKRATRTTKRGAARTPTMAVSLGSRYRDSWDTSSLVTVAMNMIFEDSGRSRADFDPADLGKIRTRISEALVHGFEE